MVESLLIIDSISLVMFFVATTLIFLNFFQGFKGMRKPPFWIYILIGFILITFHGVLVAFPLPLIPSSAIALIRLLGNFAVLIGMYKLYKAQTVKIKFDKELETSIK